MTSVLITGYATGLGRYLSEYLTTQYLTVTGISRSTGHDIAAKDGRARIVTESLGHHVFINNAWSLEDPFAQTLLLDKMYTEWVFQEKSGVIINIGSRAAVESRALCRMTEEQGQGYLRYSTAKKLLLEKSDEIAAARNPGIQVCCLNFGYLDTDQFRDKKVKIPLLAAGKTVATVIELALSSPPIQIRNMTVEAVG